MIYEDLPPANRQEVVAALQSEDSETIARMLIRMALHEDDSSWAESRCLEALQDSSDEEVCAAAITSLGHLARIHGRISPVALQALRRLQTHPTLGGRAEDALDDILVYVKT